MEPLILSYFYGVFALISDCIMLHVESTELCFVANSGNMEIVSGKNMEILSDGGKTRCSGRHAADASILSSSPNLTSSLHSHTKWNIVFVLSLYCTICPLYKWFCTSAVQCGAVVQFVQIGLNLWRSCQKRN